MTGGDGDGAEGPEERRADQRADEQGAAYDVLAETAPARELDEPPPAPPPSPDDEDAGADAGPPARPVAVLRAGLRVTPELRGGLGFTVLMALAQAGGKLAVPVLVQQVLDRGVLGTDGFQPGFVYPACAATTALVVVLYIVSRATYLRLVAASEASLLGLRSRTFEHIHRLPIAEHEEHRRGALVARVTSDIETLAAFFEQGAVSWVVNTLLIASTVAVMAVYEWRLAVVAVVVLAPLALLFRTLQHRQLAAQDTVRNAVSDTLAEVSEAVGGAAVIRAYGLEDRTRDRVGAAVDRQYRAHMLGARYLALAFPLGDLFGTLALAGVAVVGVTQGPGWGLEVGEVVAVLFLVGLLLNPISNLSEIMDQTQIALAGWRKVLGVLATPIDLVEPSPGVAVPPGPLAVEMVDVAFAYRDGPLVLRDIDVLLPAGARVAVVGETGSGKSTFATLLCRLADPVAGSVRVGGLDLRDVSPDARRRGIRLVPQDGFLFDDSVAANVLAGGDGDVRGAFDELGLGWWVDRLPEGLDTPVGRAGRQPVGRRAPAGRPGPGPAGRPRPARARRGHQRGRRRDRPGAHRRPHPAGRRADRRRHRPPAGHRPGRRPGACVRRRADRRARHPRLARRRRRYLRPPLRELAGQHPGRRAVGRGGRPSGRPGPGRGADGADLVQVGVEGVDHQEHVVVGDVEARGVGLAHGVGHRVVVDDHDLGLVAGPGSPSSSRSSSSPSPSPALPGSSPGRPRRPLRRRWSSSAPTSSRTSS